MSQQRKVKRSGSKADLLKEQREAKSQNWEKEAKLRRLFDEFVAYRQILALAISQKGGDWIVRESDFDSLPKQVRILFDPVEGEEGAVHVKLIPVEFDEAFGEEE